MSEAVDLPPLSDESWLCAPGCDDDVAMSTRIRLARNVDGFPFRARMNEDHEDALEHYLTRRLERVASDPPLQYVSLHDLASLQKQMLFERHLISMEHLKGEGRRGVAFNDPGDVSVMINEEDHLRIQVMSSGFCPDELYKRIEAIDDRFDSEVCYAFHARFGYLTSCPTNVGIGMRASVMLHLPALVISKHIETVFNSVSKMSLAARGYYGEGTEPLGDLFQISNQITLGRTPEDVLLELKKAIPKIVEYERKVRGQLLDDSRKVLEDKVWRAYGLLTHARSISSEETLQLLSHVRMGAYLNLLPSLSTQKIQELLVTTQPAHLQSGLGESLDAEARDVARAERIRECLSA